MSDENTPQLPPDVQAAWEAQEQGVNVPPLRQQVQDVPSMAVNPPQQRKRSPFRSSRNFVAGEITIQDTTYGYRELDDNLEKWMQERRQWLADKLGITLEALDSDNFKGAKPDELAKLNDHLEETYNLLLSGPTPDIRGVLVEWDAEDDNGDIVPINKENVSDLGFEIKSQLADHVKASTLLGVGQGQYFRGRNNGAR
ncbi:MAG: hypothetical protein JO316_15645 [Abitibacteriaceae bacterium]|nr:hypothetical protein [Abditibacteriaceae bacterium]